MGKISSIVPLILTILLIIVGAGVAFIVYEIVNSISQTTSKKMEKHNISVSRDGMKVGVKEVSTEKYTDHTQGVLMKVWNHANWPGYTSKLGWGQPKVPTPTSSGRSTPAQTPGVGSENRKPFSRHGSSQQSVRKA